MLLLKAVLNILVRNASPRGPMCFRCLIFNMSGPCELLFILLFYSLLDLRSSECDVVSLYVLSESRLCVFCKLCPVCFLVIGKGPSVLLSSVVMSYVKCGNYG